MRYILPVVEILLAVAFFVIQQTDIGSKLDVSSPPYWIAAKYLVFLAIVDAVRRLTRMWFARRQKTNSSNKANFDYGVNNIAKMLALLGSIIYLFQLFGVDIKTLLTSLSIVAAAIAIITKEYINDFLVGLYFSFSKNFEIHDYVKIGEQKGKITELQLLKLRLLNDDDDAVLIPNSKVYNTEIINYTRRDIRLMSIDFELGIAHLHNIEALEQDLIAALASFSEYIESTSYNLRIVEMKKDYVELKFQYSLQRFDRDMQRSIRKKTVREVFNYIAGKVAQNQPVPQKD